MAKSKARLRCKCPLFAAYVRGNRALRAVMIAPQAQVISDELPFGNVISEERGTPRVMVAP